MVRPDAGYGYGYARASWELNLGCEQCYLLEALAGLEWPGREHLLNVMAQAGILWLQLTGEPLIDPLFAEPAPPPTTRG